MDKENKKRVFDELYKLIEIYNYKIEEHHKRIEDKERIITTERLRYCLNDIDKLLLKIECTNETIVYLDSNL